MTSNAGNSQEITEKPLHQAVISGDHEKVVSLIEEGYGVMEELADGRTPLDGASYLGDDILITKILVEAGSDVHHKDKMGYTFLHHCAQDDVSYAILYLNEIIVDFGLEETDNAGMTPLHWAAYLGNMRSLGCLLHVGANAKARDSQGRTPLHLSMLGKSMQCSKELIEAGAEVMMTDSEGHTPLDLVPNDAARMAGSMKGLIENISSFKKRKSQISTRLFTIKRSLFYFLSVFIPLMLGSMGMFIVPSYFKFVFFLAGFACFFLRRIIFDEERQVAFIKLKESYIKHSESRGFDQEFEYVGWVYMVIAYTGLVLLYSLYIGYVHLDTTHIVFVVLTFICNLGVLALALRITLGNAGVVTQENSARSVNEFYNNLRQGLKPFQRFCTTCRQVIPIRGKHCGDCQTCFHKMDHHCIWLGSCIGQGNHLYFLMIMILSCILCIATVIAVISDCAYLLLETNNMKEIFMTLVISNWNIFIVSPVAVVVFVFILYMLAYHLQLIFKNVTLNEEYGGFKYAYFRGRSPTLMTSVIAVMLQISSEGAYCSLKMGLRGNTWKLIFIEVESANLIIK